MNKYNILIVDDNRGFVKSIITVLKEKFIIIPSYSISEAIKKINKDIDLVLLDLVFDENIPDKTEGMDFLPEIIKQYPGLPVVIMTNFPTYEKSVEAIKLGAKDFLLKKRLDWTEWGNRIFNYCHDYHEIQMLKEKTSKLEKKYDDAEMIGISPQIKFIRERLKDLAINSKDANIFIQGETGTGKNLAVKYFRKYSVRKDRPYKETSLIELSGSLLESELFGHTRGAFTGAEKNKTGLFEEANGGILFLDEIGDYDLITQQKIMRFLEDKTITPVGSTKTKKLDVQLIMATNKNLVQLIKEGKFREDLYHRINRIKIELPPLRERRDDIKIITDYFFNHFSVKEKTNLKKITIEVYNIFREYNWSGNVRELQSVIMEACTNARMYNDTELQIKHLRKEIITPFQQDESEGRFDNLKKKKIEIELQAIDDALGETYGQKTEAARLIGMTADQMRYRVITSYNSPEFNAKFINIKRYYKL